MLAQWHPQLIFFVIASGLFASALAGSQVVQEIPVTRPDAFSTDSPSPSTSIVSRSISASSFHNSHSFPHHSLLSKHSSIITSKASSSPTDSNSPASTPLASSVDPATLQDINTIHTRRLPIIIATASGASNISAWLSTLGANGQWPASEIDYTAGCDAQRANWPAESHWKRIVTMSAAFHGGLKGTEQFVNSSSLRANITLAMDFWFENDFTDPSCIDSGGLAACPCGTPGFWNPNWFSNIIGIPQLVGEACLLLNDTLTSTQLSNCTNIALRAYATFGRQINGLGTLTGSNTLDVASAAIDSALLTINVSLITDAYARVHNEVVVQQAVKADGIRPDGSFGQHEGIIYNGNYGKDYANDVLALEIEAGGTQFAAGNASRDAFTSLMEGSQWMIFANVITGVLHWDFSVLGRFISFPVADEQATGGIKINLTQVQELGQEWDSANLTQVFNNLSQNNTNANAGSLNGNRMFYDNDYMVHRGEGYVTTLRMYSNRTQNSECDNSENPFGFHLSDGTVYTYLTGDEYEDIAAAWDWNLIPGITVDYNATPLLCGETQWAGIQPFVGGASDGSIGAAAMHYTNPFTQTLSWQKAWFFLEDDVQHVMINSITSATNASVFSVLDQRRHVGDVMVDGASVETGNYTGASSLWHGNVGYTFQEQWEGGTFLSVEVGNRTGNWSTLGISTQPPPTIDLFAAWLYHEDLNASTSYSIYPTTDYPYFNRKRHSTDLRNIQNDASISAVYDATHDTAMIVFWEATGGQVTVPLSPPYAPITVVSNRGVITILRLGTWNVTVADPAQTFTDATLNLTLGVGKKPRGWGQGRSRELSFDLPADGLAGSSVTSSVMD